jgi:hypothetical protein
VREQEALVVDGGSCPEREKLEESLGSEVDGCCREDWRRLKGGGREIRREGEGREEETDDENVDVVWMRPVSLSLRRYVDCIVNQDRRY